MVTKIKQTGIADLAVGQGQLAADSVTAAKIVDGAVGSAEIATDGVGADEIATGAVGTAELATGAVTSADIADGDIAYIDLRTDARAAFIRTFISAEQTIASGGLQTLTHGLPTKPTLFQYTLVCKIAQNGWAVNDEVEVALGHYDGTRFNAVWADATNIFVRYSDAASPFVIGNKATGVIAQLTNANWRLKVRAYSP